MEPWAQHFSSLNLCEHLCSLGLSVPDSFHYLPQSQITLTWVPYTVCFDEWHHFVTALCYLAISALLWEQAQVSASDVHVSDSWTSQELGTHYESKPQLS